METNSPSYLMITRAIGKKMSGIGVAGILWDTKLAAAIVGGIVPLNEGGRTPKMGATVPLLACYAVWSPY